MQVIGTHPIMVVALIWDWENMGSAGKPQYFALAYNIFVGGSLIYWAYFSVVKKLFVTFSTTSTLTVPFIVVLTDAVFRSAWPSLSDTGALMLVAIAVILALIKSQRPQKMYCEFRHESNFF